MYKYINEPEKWPKRQYEEDPLAGPLTLEKKKSTTGYVLNSLF